MHLFFCLFISRCTSSASETYILLFLSVLTSFAIIPVPVLHSLSLSCPLSVTLPLFSARCDQLGYFSPTDIPGDRTSGGHALLHLSSFCLPSLSPLHTRLCCHSCSSSPSAPLPTSPQQCKQQTSLLSPIFPPVNLALIPHGANSDISASALLSCVSPVIYPPFALPFMFGLHADSDAPPFFPSALSALTLFHPFLFSLSLPLPLSRSLLVAVHNDGPVFPSCMPTVHLYPSNHLSFGSGAPCGASKQDAGGMKNKHSRLSSSLHPFSHSFTRKDEAKLRWSWRLKMGPHIQIHALKLIQTHF